MRAKFKPNTDAEEAAIQRGIEQDPDSPELGAEWFAGARPAAEMMPAEVYAELTARTEAQRRRGPGKRPAKVQVTLRLDRDVVDGLRASGPGWQVRANEVLRRLASRRGS